MDITLIQHTSFYAGVLTLIYMLLTFRVIALRWKYKVGISHGEEMELHRAIRVHGNFSEYVPLSIALMLMAELNQAGDWTLHILGVSLLLGRIFHAMGLSKSHGTSMPRFVGNVLTFGMLIAAAIMNIMAVY